MNSARSTGLSPQRRKVAVLGGSIAAMSGGMAVLAQHHPQVIWAWLGFLVLAVIYAGIQLVKIRAQENRSKGPRA